MAKKKTEEEAPSYTPITRDDVFAHLTDKFSELAKATKVNVDNELANFRTPVATSFELGDDPAVVLPLAEFYALRRLYAAFVANGISLPDGLEDQIEAARTTIAQLPFDPPLSV